MTSYLIEQNFSALERLDTGGVRLCLHGDWTLENARAIDGEISALMGERGHIDAVDCARLGKLDTTGTVLVRRYATRLCSTDQVPLENIRPRHRALLGTIRECPPAVEPAPPSIWYQDVLAEIGDASLQIVYQAASLLSFIGLVMTRLFGLFVHPKRLRFIPLLYQLEAVGFKALWIVGLISFLIGAVMVNQGAVQLAKFGADIFVIDMLGISHLRELGILLTAIIVAGRSGSAFTAQIGSMKLHEEIDAMLTIGMNPVDVLVLPRVVALVIALPLLTFYADMVGIAGGALMAWGQLGITPANFIFYFRDVISIDHFWVGIIKAPFFAAVIAISGCYQGLTVAQSADSLGQHTTTSVVQSIFLVITLDAFFAIFFTAVGL